MLSYPHNSDQLELDLTRYEVRHNGRVLKIERIPMELFIFLAENRDRLVSREAIVERLWGKDVFLDTEQGINTAIRKIRLALHDDPEQPRFLQTVVGKGYRLVGSVEILGGGSSSATSTEGQLPAPSVGGGAPGNLRLGSIEWQKSTTALSVLLILILAAFALKYFGVVHPRLQGPAFRSIAVLPLENLSGDPSQEYFADGMTDELITNLAKIESLRVISRTSVMRYKAARQPLSKIARELHVDLILEGTVSRSGERVRITTQLVDGKSDVHLWAEDFHREVYDVLAMQSEIARAIAREIRIEMTKEDIVRLSADRKVSPGAHDAYLKARYLWNQRTGRALNDSIAFYQQAIAADPTYALAYAGLADSYIVLENNGKLSPAVANPAIKASAMKAVEIDPDLADAHMVLGQVKETDWDWAGAEREYRRAIQLNPGLARAHHWYAILLMEMHRSGEGIAEIERAVDLDPLVGSLYCVQSRIYYLAHQYDIALRPLQMLQEFGKESVAVHELSGFVFLGKQMYPEAISEFLISASAEPQEPEEWALLTYAYARSGRRKEALDTLCKLDKLGHSRFLEPSWMSVAWTGLGDKDQAFYFLRESARIRSSGLPFLVADPVFDPLRSDSRFQDFLQQLGLPPS